MRNAWVKRSKWVALTLVAGAALAAAAAVGVRSTGAQSKTGNPSVDARAGNPAGPAATGPGSGFAELSNRYIVVYREEPLATYKGDIQGLAAPERMRPSASAARAAAATGNAPTPRIAVRGARAQDYVRFLADRQVQHEARINAALGRAVRVERRMQHAINASVLQMNPQEAERVRALSDVELVEEYREYEQDTDLGPGLIGAPALWNGTPTPFRGEGVVIGVIDSGINFGSPAFTARAEDGYEHVNPLGAGNYLGTCAPGGIDEGRCNSKLIGGYDFVCGAPGNQCGVADVREEPGFGDTNGHGSHTASTAAGNPHTASYRGNQIHISGVAPRANIIAYDACYTEVSTGRGFCPNTSTLAAVNQALADGVVDVINYSIAGGTAPWGEAVSLAFLNASDAGIYVATSAGNSGPGPNTMGHLEPWTGSTAAATHGRGDIVLFAAVSGPGSVPPALTAILLTEGSGGVPFATPIPATAPLRVSAGIDSANDGCAPFPASTFRGAIAVIRRGSCNFSDKVNNAAAAGAVAVLIGNNQSTPFEPSVAGATIPAFAIDQSDANALRTFASSVGNNATAGIAYPASKISNTPDVLGDFSSRGPAGIFDLVKPDVTAPGVRVLAVVAGNQVTGSENAVGLMDGTSMASPHHAGAAALLRQARPDWTVQETRSALMMTARQEVLKENGVTPADAFAMGAGRIQVDQALRAGLVLNETKTRFLAANPANSGEVSSLNIASLGKRSCPDSCSFTRVFRNVLPTRQTWTAKVQGMTAIVSPSVFTLAPGESKSVRIIVTTGSVPNDGSWRFARLTLAPQGGDTSQPMLRLPIAVSVPPPQIAATPPLNTLTLPAGGSGAVNLQIANTGGSPLEWQIDNSGVGTRTLVAQAANNSNGRRSTRFTDAVTVGARAQLAADDFTLGEATGITRIVADGFVNGGTLATSTNINWSIYRDVGGNPEGNPESSPQLAVWTYTSTVSGPGVRTSATLAMINLDMAAAGQNVNLAAGRYWLVVSVRAPLATSWFWFNATSGDNVYRSAIINPDGSGAWSAATGAPGLAYGLGGSNACGAGWIGTPTRALGRISAGSSQSTQVQINASGLAPGSYSGFVCVGSNDPSTPKTAVRVALTVTP